MKKQSLLKMTAGGMLTAFVLLATLLLRIPLPYGYAHLGDGVIFLSALLVGPYAALIAGLGSALADILGGYGLYALPTFCIKAGMGLIAGILCKQSRHLQNALVFALAECLMVVGYFVFEGFLYGWAAAVGGVAANLAQGAAGVLTGVLLSAAASRVMPLR